MHSGGGDTPSRVPGFPIRKPPDHSLAAGSPGHIAGSSVLHRLLVPRHPPCALKNLAHTYALQQLRRGPPRHAGGSRIDARVHCAVLKKRPAPAPAPAPAKGETARRPARTRKPAAPQGAGSLRTQQRAQPHPPPGARVPRPDQLGRTNQDPDRKSG